MMMKQIEFKDIDMMGDLAYRAVMNYGRLEGKWYRPTEVFTADLHGWPGDWEGRIMLALTLLSQSTHRVPAYLDEMISLVPEKLNEKGYFGKILPDGMFDEQQMAGNSWFLRAMVEYYNWKQDENVKEIIVKLAQNLLLTARGKYKMYPIDSENRFQNQDVWILSRLQTKSKKHAESSDAGCGFIMLDGATAAYELLGWPELKELIDEMIERFLEMDLVALHIQTHATLSATRGIIRFYEITREEKYLCYAKTVFELYKKEAWSEAYGNYNWFGTPRWTEPCAIIDSFLVSVNLWKNTGISEYLEDAHHIYFNAVTHANRYNGTFGTDRCVGAEQAEDNLNISPLTFEVYWCCNMRGGEGFARAIEYNFFTKDNEIYVPFYNDCEATLRLEEGVICFSEKARYPYDGTVRFEVLSTELEAIRKMNFFAPLWSDQENIKVTINGTQVTTEFQEGFVSIESMLKAGDIISLDLGLSLRIEGADFKNSVRGYHKFFYGPLLLGYKKAGIASKEGGKANENSVDDLEKSDFEGAAEINLPMSTVFERIGKSQFKVVGTETILEALCSVEDMTKEDSIHQVLFKS